MTFLPIVTRELRLASRRNTTYRARMINAGVACILGGYVLILLKAMGMGRGIGPSPLSIIGFPMLYMTLFGGAAAADSVSREKREGTLGLLFLTDLKGYDVILGKFCASATASFYGLLAMMPIVSFTLLLGGVTGGEIVRAGLILINSVFFSHAAAIVVSTFSKNARRAVSGATLLILFFVMFLPILSAVLTRYHLFTLSMILNAMSPLTPAQHFSNLGFRPGPFWLALLGSHLCGWIFLILASWRLPQSWQDQASAKRLRWRERFRQWSYGNLKTRTAYRERLLAINPFYWLINRARFKGAFIWGVMAAMVLGAAYICLKVGDWGAILGICIVTQIALHATIKLWLANEAGNCLEEERQNGGLELLLCCTPLDIPEILQACWRSLRRIFLWPTLLVLLTNVILMIAVKREVGPDAKSELTGYLWFAPASMVMLVVDAISLGWVGMWGGLTAKKNKRASGKAIRQVLLLPWALLGLIVWLIPNQTRSKMEFQHYLLIWFVLGIGVSVICALLARQNLLTQFRALAAPEYGDEPLTFFGRLGRALGKRSA